MKKLLLFSAVLFCAFYAQCQTINDSAVLRTNINTYIVPKSSITASKLNSILNGLQNVSAKKMDSVWVVADTLFYKKNGQTSYTTLEQCPQLWLNIEGNPMDNVSFADLLNAKQATLPGAAYTRSYLGNGNVYRNLQTDLMPLINATFDSATMRWTYGDRNNLVKYQFNTFKNFDTINVYGGTFYYNGSARGTLPSASGSGIVNVFVRNDSNYMNGVDKAFMYGFDNQNSYFFSRYYDGAAWSAYTYAIRRDNNVYLTYDKQTSAPALPAVGSIQNTVDGSLRFKWIYSDGRYVRFDTTGMNGANIDAAWSAITLQGNTFNGASQLVKLSAGSELPTVGGTNLTGVMHGGNNLSELTNTSTARTALGLGTMATQAKTAVDITGGTVQGLSDMQLPLASSLVNNGSIAINSGTHNLLFRTGSTDYIGLTASNNLSDITNAATARSNLGVAIGTDVLAPNGSAASLTSFPTLNQNTTGSAARWTTGRTLAITGDLAYTSPSIDGTGNVTAVGTIQAGAVSQSKTANYTAKTLWANPTGSAAAPSDVTFEQLDETAYTGTISWTATTAPSGTLTTNYRYTRLGKKVEITLNFTYSVAGNNCTQVTFTLPAGAPTPVKPTGLTANGDQLYAGTGVTATGTAPNTVSNSCKGGLAYDGTNYLLVINNTGASTKSGWITLSYYTANY